MEMKNEMLKQQNLLFELHESEFIGFTIKDSDLIFKVAIFASPPQSVTPYSRAILMNILGQLSSFD